MLFVCFFFSFWESDDQCYLDDNVFFIVF